MDINNLKLDMGNRIRGIRKSNRETQAQFAERLDISINFLSEIENGKKGLSSETLYKICVNYHVSSDYILLGKDDNNRNYKMDIIEAANKISRAELSIVCEYLNALDKMRNGI